ncbi:MAG: hypothetical protein QXQ70_03595 [Candidatus Caldarchaeum sp.]
MKILGGLGYIFLIIPVLNIIAPILVGIAWIQMGGRTRQTLFKATGILMIVSFILVIGVFAAFFTVLSPLISSALSGFTNLSPTVLLTLMSAVGALVVVSIAAAVFGLVVFVLELVSHFRAADIYALNWFRRAAWMRIIAIILAMVVVAVVLAMATPTTLPAESFTASIFLLALIPVIIVGVLAPIFSAIAFFSLPEESLPPPPPAQPA